MRLVFVVVAVTVVVSRCRLPPRPLLNVLCEHAMFPLPSRARPALLSSWPACARVPRLPLPCLRAAGVRQIEATSFVPPKLVPQMADAKEVARTGRFVSARLLPLVVAF